ncbi:efflux RND transporter periplasmic adaptor subunit [Trichlorobacter lovleyi]|uniref:efflux RND transporter periplasmic adaptor subunit n=1 Tax=Trichlorobacter lovleyi TaxID=313985 RepID=UPI00223FB80E|nr:efflux RND transporter periplasmic adaptor subunit [Trichlorobacter lovleyi]QOX78487.1 efflux RND transporter periplasmic adaptor subunit [Trichlorobacter lovleyi]
MIALGMLAALAGCNRQEPAKSAQLPAEVVVVTVQPRTVPAVFPFVGQVQSSHQVDIMARVSGFLEKISYQEGGPVKHGQVLFQIDKKPFVAAADAAKAEVDTRKSQLFTAKANLERVRPLAEQNAASKSDLDNAIGNFKGAEAGLQQAQANYAKALLDVGYTTITSPISGVSGQALMREGAYISAGSSSAKLTYVAKLDPVWVDFSISQNQQATVRQQVESGQLIRPKDGRFTTELELSDGSRYPQTGVVNFADPSYSKDTGTYLVRAEIANPKGGLRPGMYVKVWLKGASRPNALVVPQRAVQQSGNGNVLYVVNDKQQAELRPVTVGDWLGNDWIITQGLRPGERVVVDGFMRLAPGAPVKVVAADEPQQAGPVAQAAR